MRGALRTLLLIALLGAGCAGPPVQRMEPEALRRAAGEGDAEAARRLAEQLAAGRVEGGTVAEARRLLEGLGEVATPEDRALAARLAGAAGHADEAFAAWVALMADPTAPPWLARYAARRARTWVDRVDLRATRSPLPLRLPGDPAATAAAHLAEAVAVRLDDAAGLERARAALGSVRRYDRTGRLAPWPALSLPGAEAVLTVGSGERQPPAVEADVATPDGTVAFPEEGPGLYAARLPLPAEAGPLELEVVGADGLRVFVDGRAVATHDGLRTWGPRRVVTALPPSSRGDVEVQVASRSVAPEVTAAVRAAARRPAVPPGERLVGRLARLEEALWRGDPLAAGEAAAALEADARGVAALDLARYEAMDPTRPMALTRPRSRRLLREALDRLPDLHEARLRLARHLLDAGETSTAAGLVADALPPATAREAALASARALGRTAEAGRLAEERLERWPTSCDAARALLELRWEPLRYGPSRLPDPLPGCFDVRLRAAALLREGRSLDAAEERLVGLLRRAAPGSERSRVRESLARVAWARGDEQALRRHARAGLAEGRRPEVFLDLLRSVALLAADDARAADLAGRLREEPGISTEARRPVLDGREDLGLPLEDGEALARVAHARSAEEGVEESTAPVEVLLEERHVRAFPDGMTVHRVHRVFRLLDGDAAEEWGEIPLPDGAEVLRAVTWKPTPDGDLQPIEPEDLQATGAISLTALQPGAIGEAAWFWIEPPDAALDGGWILERFAFERTDARVERARMVLRAPPGTPVTFVTTGPAPEWAVPEPGLHVLTARDRPRVLPEPLDPRPDRRLSTVRALGGGADAARLQRFVRDRLRSATRGGPVVARLAARALEEAGDAPRARLRALYATVLDEIQAGEELPWSGVASWIAATRAGERTTLLLALCAEAGLTCELALARPWSRGVPDPPGAPVDPDDWVYPLVRARLPDGDVWLDPSTRYVPFGYVPPLIQKAPALRLEAGEGVIRTPDLSDAGGSREMDVAVRVAPDGTWRATGVEHLSVLHGMSWRQALVDRVPEARERALAGVVRQSLPGAAVESIELEGLHGRDEPLTFRWEATGRLPEPVPGRWALTLGLSPENLSRATIHLPERETPLFLASQGRLRMTVRLELPEGWRLLDLPEPMRVRHRLVSYDRAVRLDEAERALTITKDYRQDLGLVPPEGYRVWIDVARAVDRADALHLVLAAPSE